MGDKVQIELQPLGERFQVDRGTPLQDVLFEHGVEFPCGGKGRCKGCRVRIIRGALPIDDRHASILNPQELAGGWRLACCSRANSDLVLDVGQWEETILADSSTFAFTSRDGLGVAVDLGTTTLVAQLLDRRTGRVLAVESDLNPQAAHGADVMSRVQFAVDRAGREKLTSLIRSIIGRMIGRLMATALSEPEAQARDTRHESTLAGAAGSEITDRLKAGPTQLRRVVIVGNTVMHHLFCGLDVRPLAVVPFETEHGGLQSFTARDLGWSLEGDPRIDFLPSLGSFVGSDILAGILATRLHESDAPVGLVDLGTNGEIIIGNRQRMLCASTAAGPAFEGARITMGMRAATGAISQVRVDDGVFRCHVIGQVAPRGICGSGLVDAVAAGLDVGLIQPGGRLAGGRKELILAEPVRLTQGDIRELQLAKAAISAGIRMLVEQWGTTPDGVTALYIAGAFGNYINLASARRIGLIDWPADKVHVAGNTALLGAKLALFQQDGQTGDYADIRARVQHVPLASDPKFMDEYVGAMVFPDRED